MRTGWMAGWMAAAAALLVPGLAQAQDWRLASQGQNTGSTFFLDVDSVTAPGALRRGTAFMVLAKPDNGLAAIQAEFEYECATNRKRILSMLVYDEKEQQGQRFPGKNEWEETPPNTQYGKLGDLICGKTPIPDRSYGAAPPFAAARSLRGTGN